MKSLFYLFLFVFSSTVFSQQLVLFADNLEQHADVHKIKNIASLYSKKSEMAFGKMLLKNYSMQTQEINLKDNPNSKKFINSFLLPEFFNVEKHKEHYIIEEYFTYDIFGEEKFVAKVNGNRYIEKKETVYNSEKFGTMSSSKMDTSFITTDILIGDEQKLCRFDWAIQNDINTNIEGTAEFANDTLQIRTSRNAKKHAARGVEIIRDNKVIAGIQLRGPGYIVVANGLNKELEKLVYAILSSSRNHFI
jgi:hypothetical protein